MEDNQNFDHQVEATTEYVADQDTASQQDAETQESVEVDQQEEEFDVIRYNKEEVKIPKSERQTYLQKGYNYDKVQSQLEQTKQQAAYLERMARMSGYDNIEAFTQAIEAAEEQQRIQQQSQKMGIDENTYRQYFQPVDQRLRQYEGELQGLRLERAKTQVERQINELNQRYPDFSTYQEQTFQLALQQGLDLETAYKVASYEEKISNLKRETEQEVLAKVTGRDSKQVLPSGDKPSNNKINPANMSFKDIEEISRRVRAGERVTF
ncbi:hypothetical protein [Brevibacillus centrosporus]|uniref:hypothetical protein n=1 Tax=Brevibacillus centrosporus TaxID=54910 RepID=UPI002E1FA792|nr:hypothetical protein [Brevibacillus centrosporus]